MLIKCKSSANIEQLDEVWNSCVFVLMTFNIHTNDTMSHLLTGNTFFISPGDVIIPRSDVVVQCDIDRLVMIGETMNGRRLSCRLAHFGVESTESCYCT